MDNDDRLVQWDSPFVQWEANIGLHTGQIGGDQGLDESLGGEFSFTCQDTARSTFELTSADLPVCNFPTVTSFLQQSLSFEDRHEEPTRIHEALAPADSIFMDSRPCFQLRTKNEPWKEAFERLHSNLEPAEYGFLAAIEAGHSQTNSPQNSATNFSPKVSMVAGDQDVFCMSIEDASSSANLIVFNPLTQKLQNLPLTHIRNPVLLHVLTGDHGHCKVIVAGASTSIDSCHPVSCTTYVYDSKKGTWKNLPGPSFALKEFQTGAYYMDFEGRKYLCCVADVNMEGTKGVILFDTENELWVQHSIERYIPHVKGMIPKSVGSITRAQIVGCGRERGGLVFVYSEQECEGDKYLCIHKLDPDNFNGEDRWEEIVMKKQTNHEPVSVGLQPIPQFPCIPLTATVIIDSWGDPIVFSEQELDELVFIKISMYKGHLDSDEGIWEEIQCFSSKHSTSRHRSKNWALEERLVLLRSKEVAPERVNGAPWKFTSKELEKRRFNRGPQGCENQWGTLLKRYKDLPKELRSRNNNSGDQSSLKEFWERQERKVRNTFNSECYEIMHRILTKGTQNKRPLKQKVHEAEARPQTSPASTSRAPRSEILDNSEGHGNEQRPGSSTAMDGVVELIAGGGQNYTNDQRIEVLKEINREKELRFKENELRFKEKELQIKSQKLARAAPKRRKRKLK